MTDILREDQIMRNVQQLAYDGSKLYCPKHPCNQLRESLTSGEGGPFSMTCIAMMEGGMPCGNSAQWRTREDMERELGEVRNSN